MVVFVLLAELRPPIYQATNRRKSVYNASYCVSKKSIYPLHQQPKPPIANFWCRHVKPSAPPSRSHSRPLFSFSHLRTPHGSFIHPLRTLITHQSHISCHYIPRIAVVVATVEKNTKKHQQQRQTQHVLYTGISKKKISASILLTTPRPHSFSLETLQPKNAQF